MSNQELDVALEALVDRFTLAEVLAGLARVSAEKACHLESNWQDSRSAKIWERACHKLDVMSGSLSNYGI